MTILQKYVLRPSQGVRDAYMGIGGLLLILAIIAFAGASFSFDAERKALLRPIGAVLGVLGAICWARGSIVPKESGGR